MLGNRELALKRKLWKLMCRSMSKGWCEEEGRGNLTLLQPMTTVSTVHLSAAWLLSDS